MSDNEHGRARGGARRERTAAPPPRRAGPAARPLSRPIER